MTIVGELAAFGGLLGFVVGWAMEEISFRGQEREADRRALICGNGLNFSHKSLDPAALVARELLMRFLTPQQQHDYSRRGAFTVETERASYLMGHGMRVGVTFSGSEVMTPVCVVFEGQGVRRQPPDEDRVLAILLMIRTAEEEFIEQFMFRPARMRDAFGATPIYTMIPDAILRDDL